MRLGFGTQRRERRSLLDELPDGTEIATSDCSINISTSDFESDHERRTWIIKTTNAFTNVLRPRLRKWCEETQR